MTHTAPRRVALIVTTVLAATAIAWAADVLTQLGVPAPMAKEAVVSAISGGYFNTSLGYKVLKASPPAARAELVSGAIAWAKAYVASPEFQAAYARVRGAQKPEEPKFIGTPEEEFAKKQAQQKAEQEKSTAEMKATLPQLPPETRKAVEDGMKVAAEMQAKMDTPEMRKMQIDGIVMERTSKKQEYDRDLKKWQEGYPETPRPLVIKRLQKFLADTKDIDFDAALTTRNGHKVFVKEEYENKSGEWKQAFRAGREAVTAARAAVQAWLTELQKTS